MKFCKHKRTGRILCYSPSRAANQREFEVVEAESLDAANGVVKQEPAFEEVAIQTRVGKSRSKAKPVATEAPAPAPTADDIETLLRDVDGLDN